MSSMPRYTAHQRLRLGVSAVSFHASIAYNWWRYGNAFNFNHIAADNNEQAEVNVNGISVSLSRRGAVLGICEGTKTPLILGSIPRSQDHLEHLRTTFNLSADDGIDILSFNCDFERNWSGLSRLVETSKNVRLFRYPTIDYSAPSFIDVLRALRDLNNRQERNQKLVYVHCKSGRGRSAVIVASYLIHVLYQAGLEVSPDNVEQYLKSKRFQVSLNPEQQDRLAELQQKIMAAGGFKSLYQLHEDQIIRRDRELGVGF